MTIHRYFQVALAVMVVLIAGCRSKQQEPVRSTTQGGSSMSTSGEVADKRDHALVRFVNAIPGSAGTNAFLDTLQTFQGVSFKTVTPYHEVPDGRYTIHFGDHMQGSARRDDRMRDNNNPAVRTDKESANSESFSSGNYYTIVAYPDEDNGAPKLTVIKDKFPDVDADKAKIRVVDASPGIGDVDVHARGKKDALFSKVGSPDGDYKDVDPMTGTLEIRSSERNRVLATVPNRSFEAGKSYTIVLAGGVKGSNKVEAITVEDQLMGPKNKDARHDNSYRND